MCQEIQQSAEIIKNRLAAQTQRRKLRLRFTRPRELSPALWSGSTPRRPPWGGRNLLALGKERPDSKVVSLAHGGHRES